MGSNEKFHPLHSELHMQCLGTLIFLQPVVKGAPSGPSLTVELNSGTVGLAEHSVSLSAHGAKVETVWGVIGVLKLLSCSALAVITAAEQVAVLRGHPVYLVTGTRVVVGNAAHPDDARFVKLLKAAVDPSGPGRGLYFSYGADLTLNQQTWAALTGEAQGKPLIERANPEFVWNLRLLRPFTDPIVSPVGDKGDTVTHPQPPHMAAFVLPVMMGTVQQLPGLRFAAPSGGAPYEGRLSVIARRSTKRMGTRHWRRGADAEGAVANFVETEQLTVISPQGSTDPAATAVASFVQVRGSIPVFWSQIPNAKYKPPTAVAPHKAYAPAFDAHIKHVLANYKAVTAVNLANQHGTEGMLGEAFNRETTRLSETLQGLRLVPFDFHKVCGSSRYDKLSLLWEQIEKDVQRYGWYQEGGALPSARQSGVMRVNCIDCLDRTNVVQAWLARRQLESVLALLGVLPQGQSLATAYPKVELQFKCAWADHGDDVSRQYAGTGALKSGYTRTGKRSLGGLVDDGVKSGTRYLLNNFVDGGKQDAFDLVTGNYEVAEGKVTPFQPQANPLLPVLAALMLLAFALSHVRGNETVGGWVLKAGVPFALFCAVLDLVVRNGRRLVRRPQLRPDLAQPWQAEAAAGALKS